MEERYIVKEEGEKGGVGMVMNFSPNFDEEREKKERKKEMFLFLKSIVSFYLYKYMFPLCNGVFKPLFSLFDPF